MKLSLEEARELMDRVLKVRATARRAASLFGDRERAQEADDKAFEEFNSWVYSCTPGPTTEGSR